MDDEEDDDGTRLVPGDDIDGSGDGGPAVMAKGMVPDRFMRGYLTQGHAAQSPSVTGARGTTAIPDSGPAEPEDFGRRYLAAGHATPSPPNRPPNNPNPPGSSAAAVYASGARAYTENQRLSRTEHVMPSGSVVSTPGGFPDGGAQRHESKRRPALRGHAGHPAQPRREPAMTTGAVAMDPELAMRVLTALRAQDEPAGEDAGELRAEAGSLMGQWNAALAAVVQLPLEAARLKAKATALEAAEAARGPMAAAQAMVAEAEEAYRATAAPEEQAAATYARARHEAGVR